MLDHNVSRVLALLAATCGCWSGDRVQPASDEPPRAARVDRSGGGMVVSGSPLATEVGARVLAGGGNAVDAAVATAFALAVVEPSQSGLGGRTQAIVRTPDGRVEALDAGTEVPDGAVRGAVEPAEWGYGTVGVPGTVAGLMELHARHGSLDRSRILQPAAELAERGFVLSPGEAGRIRRSADRLSPEARRVFLGHRPGGPRPGDTLRQPDLARTLRVLAAQGPDVLYSGPIADQIAADMRRGGGWLTATDLAGYTVRDAVVVRGSYRDLELIGSYLPASGATVIEALHILETVESSELARIDGGSWAVLVGRSLLMSFEDRAQPLAPPDDLPDLITSKEWARQRAADLREPVGVAAESVESAFTTHLSVADADGMAVAITQSLGPSMGSGVVTPGLGFLHAVTLGGYLEGAEPGGRPWSSMSPFLALRDGELAFVLGAAGARRIVSALVQVIARVEDLGQSLEEAVAAPRFHPTAAAWVFEDREGTRWDAEELTDPEALGIPEVRRSGSAAYFARLHGIAYDPRSQTFVGVADPRWEGSAAGPTPWTR